MDPGIDSFILVYNFNCLLYYIFINTCEAYVYDFI